MEEDIKILEEKLEEWEVYKNIEFATESGKRLVREEQAIENLIKAYKEKEIETNNDKEMIAKLSFELGKYQEKSKEDEAVIEEMAIKIYEEGIIWENKEEVIEYFRNKAKESKL